MTCTRAFAHLAPLSLLLAAPVPAQHVLRHLPGQAAGDQLGTATAAAGDVDRDGFDDVIVGAPFADTAGADAGRARVVSGRTGQVLWQWDGAAAGDRLGAAVAAAGDVDGDGFPDLLVGASHDDAAGVDFGAARVYSGRTGGVLHEWFGSGSGDEFGAAVRSTGDLDGDGRPELIVGAPYADSNGADAGRATVFSGATGNVRFTHAGLAPGDLFGNSVAGAGDYDGDGVRDYMVGAPWHDAGYVHNGMARVYSGSSGAVLGTFYGDGNGYEFGWALCPVGDLDGDGKDEVFVAASEDKTFGDDAGMARVHKGGNGAVLQTFYGSAAYVYFGHSVAAGDVTGDGIPDLLVGARLADRSATNSGSVFVFSGFDWSTVTVLDGPGPGDQLGWSLDVAGDHNGDGLTDVVAGARYSDAGGTDSGLCLVFCGPARGPGTATRGAACPAAQPLTLGYGGTPRLGQQMQVTLSNRPGAAIGWIAFAFAAGPSIDLSALGLPGCFLHVRLDLPAVPVGFAGGTATLPFTIPAALAPCGLVLHHQAVALDPAAPGGLSVSNAGEARILP